MTSRSLFTHLAALVALLVIPGVLGAAERNGPKLKYGEFNPDHETVEMFQAMKDGAIDVKFIPQDIQGARVMIENKTKKPLNVKLPEAFAGVPILAQGGFGQQGGGFGGGGGGQAQGGGFGGGQQGGGGQGFFNVAPEKVGKIKVACVCLDHGKPDPTPRMKYDIKPIESYVDRPAVIELVKAFGRGGMNHQAVQAATWHLNNDVSWRELASKKAKEAKFLSAAQPYFNPAELEAAVRFAQAAVGKAGPETSPGKSDSISRR